MPPKAAAINAGARIVKLDATQALNKRAAKPKKTGSRSSTGGTTKKRKAGQAEDDSEKDSHGSEDDAVRSLRPPSLIPFVDTAPTQDFVNVDLDFFGFIESDYQALKNLLTQLFAHDAKDLDVAGLAADLVEGEDDTTGDVGTGVKSDGEESDPLAFIGVLPWSAVRGTILLFTY
jgi:protein BCP1